MIQQPLAFDGAAAVDVVADADDGLVSGLDARPAACDLHETQRIMGARDGRGVTHAQELLGQRGLHPLGGLGIAREDLLGDIGQYLPRGLGHVLVKGGDRGGLPAEDERAVGQGLLDLLLQLRRSLAARSSWLVAVFLDLLVRLVAMQLGDALAAINFGGRSSASGLARPSR